MMGGRQGQKSLARGSIGERIFAEVEQLTADGKKRMAAFKEIAEKTGAQVGTVSANYYRVARKRGAKLQPRRPAGRGAGSTRRTLAAVLTALEKLGAAIDAQERELAALRKENRRFSELRRLLKS